MPGARCQLHRVPHFVATSGLWLLGFSSAIAEMQVHPGIFMKTRLRKKKVSGAGRRVSYTLAKVVDF